MTANINHPIGKDLLKVILKTIKEKISFYAPLELKEACDGFFQWLEKNEFEMIKQTDTVTDRKRLKEIVESTVKRFLVQTCYFKLADQSVKGRVMRYLHVNNPDDMNVLKRIDGVTRALEENDCARLNAFREHSSFKTYLNTVISRLLHDSWRHQQKEEKREEKYGPELEAIFEKGQLSPEDVLLADEADERKEKSLKVLPRLMTALDETQRLAIQLRYTNDMKISAIARLLKKTRFKTEQMILQTVQLLRSQLLSALEKDKDEGGGKEWHT